MIPSHPLIIFPAQPTVPFERLARLLKDIRIVAELAGYENAGLITEQERTRLFLEHKETYDAVGPIRTLQPKHALR